MCETHRFLHILITKHFGRFKVRKKFCPKLKTSEIFYVRNLKASEIFRDLIVISKNVSKSIWSFWIKIFLFPPYFLIVTLLEGQWMVILLGIHWKSTQGNSVFFNGCYQMYAKVLKLGENKVDLAKILSEYLS